MVTRTWTFDIDYKQHNVRLNHGHIGGKREIWLDGNLVERGRKFIDFGTRYFLQVQEEELELDIVTKGIGFSYFLLKGGIPLPSNEELRRGTTSKELLKNQYLRNLTYWYELGRILNLNYRQNRLANWAFRHRLVGIYNGFLIVIEKGLLRNTYREGWSVLVRHSPQSLPDVEEKMRADERVRTIRGNLKNNKDGFESTQDYTWILLPLIKREAPEALAARVQSFIQVVSAWTHPISDGICEDNNCSQKLVTRRNLVFINGMPRLLCQECLDALPELGKKIQQEYQASPTHLLPGLIIAFGVAALGALLWAAVSLLLGMIAAITSGLILVGIVKAMDKMGTKRSTLSLLIAFIFTILSVTIGTISSNFLDMIRFGYPPIRGTLVEACQYTFTDPGPLIGTYVFALMGLGAYLLPILFQQKETLSRLFKPQIEIIPGNY